MTFEPLNAVGFVGHLVGRRPGIIDVGDILGSCFSFRTPTAVIAAAHCTGTLESDELVVGFLPSLTACRVRSIARHATADIAILHIEPPAPTDEVTPFQDIERDLGIGTDVAAIGFTPDTFSGATQHSRRMFRGHVQRYFSYTSPLKYKYQAIELSFASPGGLSGGPLFRVPSFALMGVMCENVESHTVLDSIEEILTEREYKLLESKRIINYGVAARLDKLEPWLNNALAATSQ